MKTPTELELSIIANAHYGDRPFTKRQETWIKEGFREGYKAAMNKPLTDEQIAEAYNSSPLYKPPAELFSGIGNFQEFSGFYNACKFMESRQAAPQPPTEAEPTKADMQRMIDGLREHMETMKAEQKALVSGLDLANQSNRNLLNQKSEAEAIAEALANWSKKYPRSSIYHMASQETLDGELIAIERRAVAWKEKNTQTEGS